VKESYRFDEDPDGTHRVYLMDKQKLSTFDAVGRIAKKFGLKPGSISYCGLKDKQGRTEQLIAVDGFDVDMQDPDLRLKFLGRIAEPLTAANTTSNRFAVTVRQLREQEMQDVTMAVAEVGRLGVVNYFDNQRFGSLKHGQGFIAKDLLKGDFEAALKNYMAVPSTLDLSDDAKVKAFWAANWGDWSQHCPYDTANKKYGRVLNVLRKQPPGELLPSAHQVDREFRVMKALEGTGVPVHAASFVTLVSGETYWMPFIGHDEDVSAVAGKVPDVATFKAPKVVLGLRGLSVVSVELDHLEVEPSGGYEGVGKALDAFVAKASATRSSVAHTSSTRPSRRSSTCRV
jgi:hypothetical protein